MEKTPIASRRGFLNSLGVAVGGAGLAAAGLVGGPRIVQAAAETAKGKIPDTPFKVGHMTFLTSAAAVLGEPSLKGHTMAAEEITPRAGSSASGRSKPSPPTKPQGPTPMSKNSGG